MSSGFRVTGVHYRSGTSFAVGTIIDAYLSGSDVEMLYAKWEEHSDWPEPLAFSGGIKAITCEMVLEVPRGALFKAFGPKKAPEIIDVAQRNAGR